MQRSWPAQSRYGGSKSAEKTRAVCLSFFAEKICSKRMAPHALTAEGKLVDNVMSTFVSTSNIFAIAFAYRHKILTDYTGNL